MLGGALKFAGVLEAKAPDSFRWEFNHMDEEDHGSVPHRSTYYGFEKIFEGWHLHDPVALYLSGGLAAIDRYFERASERFGYERGATTGVLGQVGARAIEDEDASEAHATYSRIVELDPNSAGGHFGLGEAQSIMGHEELAIEHYRHALSLDPRHRQAREKLTEHGVDLSDYPENLELPIDLLESYVGRYSDSDTEYGIVLEGQSLFVEIDGARYELYPVLSDRFRLTVAEVYLIFNSDDDGSISGLTVDQGGERTIATRIR
jgi:tetratricopeptide (TPR) repeat protein